LAAAAPGAANFLAAARAAARPGRWEAAMGTLVGRKREAAAAQGRRSPLNPLLFHRRRQQWLLVTRAPAALLALARRPHKVVTPPKNVTER